MKGGLTFDYLLKYLKKDVEIDGDELKIYLEKLEEDDYIKKEEKEYIENGDKVKGVYYYRKQRGIDFYYWGGYQKADIEKVKIENEREEQIIRDKRIVRLTSWIAFGTLAAAVYYILEILDHFFQIYPVIKKN